MIEVSGFPGRAQDCVYGAGFAAGSSRAYLATYSGKVIQVSEQGDAIRVYDLGTTPEEIVDTGRHLYFLTPTRLYVVEDGMRLARLLDVDGQGRLLVTATGFGLWAGIRSPAAPFAKAVLPQNSTAGALEPSAE